MNQTMYSDVLDKAQESLDQKRIPEVKINFQKIQVSALEEKAHWFVSGVKRKLKRRFGK